MDKQNYNLRNEKDLIQSLLGALRYNGFNIVDYISPEQNENEIISENGFCDKIKCEEPQKYECNTKMNTNENNIQEKIRKNIVQVIRGGGDDNTLSYKALLHICEYEFFPDCEVYDDGDYKMSKDVDIVVLIPNVWNKLYSSTVEEYSVFLAKGVRVFILKPEFIELVEMKNEIELFEYAMTPVQEVEA